MRSHIITFLIASTLSLSLNGNKEEPVKEQPTAQELSSAAKTAAMKKFLVMGSGLCFMGTYGALYLKARREYVPISHSKLIVDALGYTGAGFSITAASYFAALLWSKSGLFQDKA